MSKDFTRFSETINLKEEKKVFNIRVKPFISDCVGKVYFTDIQLQEGSNLTGYTLNTETMIENSVLIEAFHLLDFITVLLGTRKLSCFLTLELHQQDSMLSFTLFKAWLRVVLNYPRVMDHIN